MSKRSFLPIRSFAEQRTKPTSHQRAFSLLEVIASLLLLSIITTGLITSKTQLTRQWQRADERLKIAEEADRLLASWWTNGKPPLLSQGVLTEGYLWATRPKTLTQPTSDPIFESQTQMQDQAPLFYIVRFSVYEGNEINEAKSILEVDMTIPADAPTSQVVEP